MAAGNEQRFAQQLKKGVLEMLVLRLLAEHPSHGYELIVRLREKGGALLDVKEGTLYPILYRLEEEGCITSVWNSPDGKVSVGKVPRRVYTITDTGNTVLKQQSATWHAFAARVEECLRGESQ